MNARVQGKPCEVVFDSGSEIDIMSTDVAKYLGLTADRKGDIIQVCGVNGILCSNTGCRPYFRAVR